LGLTRRRNKYTLELAFLEMEAVKRVNISGASATGSTTPDHLLSLAQMHSGVADRLIFEITETVAMVDFEKTAGFANKRPELGCRIALDVFRASYASHQHLKNLTADIVKFDGQFAKGLHENKGNQLFVQTLLNLAAGFGAEIVGECVETEAEAQALRYRSVRYMQGYYFGAPSLRMVPTA